MTRSLVVCLAVSAAAAALSAGLCLAAGSGLLTALAAYVGVGALSLTGLTLAAAALELRAPRAATPEAKRPAYA